MSTPRLRIIGREDATHVLGPNKRAVLWVQGCSIGCPGCMIPESWPANRGESVSIQYLADWIEGLDVEGLTISGGEPSEQSEALVQFIDLVHSRRDIGILMYTGRTLDDLLLTGTDSQRRLLRQIDILIDGPFVREQSGSFLWRGSANQRILLLTERYRLALSDLADESAGIEVRFDEDGSFRIVGVPDAADMRRSMRNQLLEQGIDVRTYSVAVHPEDGNNGST